MFSQTGCLGQGVQGAWAEPRAVPAAWQVPGSVGRMLSFQITGGSAQRFSVGHICEVSVVSQSSVSSLGGR